MPHRHRGFPIWTPGRVLALVAANLAVVGAVMMIYATGRSVLLREVRAKAIQLATLVSQNVDPALLARIDDESDMQGEAYRKVLADLQRVRNSLEDIRYVYTMRPRPELGPHAWSFIVDADPDDEDADGDGRISDDEKGARPGMKYDGSTVPAMKRALLGPDADHKFTKDAWGEWMSGYAPIHDATGRAVAILGVDVPVTEFREKMRIANWAATGGLVVLLALINFSLHMIFAKSRAIAVIRALDQELHARNEQLSARNQELAQTNDSLDRTVRELNERERIMAEELRLAQEVQQRFLPREFPFRENLRCAALYRACSLIGGDLYDAFTVGTGTAAFFIADVSGHGVSAALVTAILKVSIERHAHLLEAAFAEGHGRETPALQAFLHAMNDAVAGAMRPGGFVTFCLFVVRTDTGAVWFANAGHNPPAIWAAADHHCYFFEVPANLPLGLVSDWNYEIREVAIRPGDKVILYTDGLIELNDESGFEFGMERLLGAINRSGSERPDALLAQITVATSSFASGQPPADDMAMVVVEYLGKPG